MNPENWAGTYESLPLGAEETATQTIDGAAIDAFASAIRSFNPVHMSGDWARANTPFPDRIAHGVMTTALMSAPIAAFCDRWKIRTALLSTSSKYVKPVLVGDTVTTTIRLVEKLDARNRIKLEVEATYLHGDVVMVGQAWEQAL